MGDDDRRHPPAALQGLQQLDDGSPGLRIEAARGLVGEQEWWIEQEGTAQRHPLLLAARELGRKVRLALTHSDLRQEPPRAHGQPARRKPGDAPRDHHVLERSEIGQQLLELENEADRPVAESRQLGGGE